MSEFSLVRWETPVSDARSLALVSLVDAGGLHVTVQDLRDPERRRFRFSFEKSPAYRNILEEYRLSESAPTRGLGWTRIAENSTWLRELIEREPLLDVHMPGCTHYIIVTEDDVVDVLSPDPPMIREVDAAREDESQPGKSTILYHPADRNEIEALVSQIKAESEPGKRPQPPTL